MNPIEAKKARSRRLCVVYSAETDSCDVYAVQRVGSPAFLALAVRAAATAKIATTDGEEAAHRLAGCKSDEETARVTAEIAASREARVRSMMSGPELPALMAGMDDLIRTAVLAVGVAVPGVEPGLLPIGTLPSEVCELIPPPPETPGGASLHMQPVRWSSGGPSREGELSTAEIPDVERMALAALIQEAFAPAREVTSFRGAAGAARGDVPVGKGVRKASQRGGRAARDPR